MNIKKTYSKNINGINLHFNIIRDIMLLGSDKIKYLTKDWYNRMQHTDFHLLLKVNKKAEQFSEEFYQNVYTREKNKYIKEQSDFADYKKFKKIFLESIDDVKNIKEEEIQKEFERCQEEMFNGLSIEEAFDFRQNHMIEYLKSELPLNILDKVKDIRVLALNYASSEVYKLIKEYCKSNEKFVDDKFREYGRIEIEQFKNDSIEFLEESFHDTFMLDVKEYKNDLIIKIDNKNGFTNKTSIIFKNYNIVLDENIEKSWWMYNEIYKLDNTYEIHILAQNETGLKEMILKCDDIILK